MNVLLLSAYSTPSHSYWSSLLTNNIPDFNWTYLKLPPRKFSWRIRGNPLSWYSSHSDVLKKSYDTVIATSMVDLATIIGLFPNLGKSLKIIYFHENQFEYPLSSMKNNSNVESMMVNLYGALCADKVVFNSEYNRASFLAGARKLLRKINDFSPAEVIDGIENKSQLLPVPICSRDNKQHEKIKNSIIWNHRWEYDKNPDDYYQALCILKKRGIDFKLIMMGIQFKNSPEAFEKIKKEFSNNILCWGEQSRAEYLKWLKKGEFIISTAIHEFQGLGVMEGVQMGAIPIVPDRLSYPQWFSKDYIFGNSPEELADHMENSFKTGKTLPELSDLTWSNLKNSYVNLLTNHS